MCVPLVIQLRIGIGNAGKRKSTGWLVRGVNMPLATVASEAIAERVAWLKMGLKERGYTGFFYRPGTFAMASYGESEWLGRPALTDGWQKEQIKLQHKILNRMRELGMEPIAPAFAGFVPTAFAERHPEIQFKHLEWGGFDEKYNAYVLPPETPYFKEIGKLFIEEWEKEFGKNTYYLSDSFNEMKLPVAEGDDDRETQVIGTIRRIYISFDCGRQSQCCFG